MKKKMKRILSRLCEWLRLQGFKAEKILECLEYILK